MRKRYLFIPLGIALILLLALILQPILAPHEPLPRPTPLSNTALPQTATLPPGTQPGTAYPVVTGAPSETVPPQPATTYPVLTGTLPLPSPTAGPQSFYVSPDGKPDGDGSQERPWDLKTALNGPKAVQPGATIWVRGGTYTYRDIDYLYSRVHGAPDQPVVIRTYPGERATIDAAMTVQGEWTTFWGLEMIDANPDRTERYVRKAAISIWASNVKAINNIIRDSGGFGFWWQSEASELYGNLIYNNGYQGSDRGHGHGIYTTNLNGTKLITDNIIFNNYSGINVHAYSEKTYLTGFRFAGNVSFNGEFLVGGYVPANNVEVINNYFYRGPVRLGYWMGVTNDNLFLSGNYFHASNNASLNIRYWNNIRADQNTVWFAGRNAVDSPTLKEGSAYTNQKPGGMDIFVEPNQYDKDRGQIIIYNWDRKDTAQVDITSLGWKPGDAYVLHNAENFFAEQATGIYDGKPLEIPMTGWTIASPVGLTRPLQPATFPEFGVFVIEKVPGK